MTEFFRILNDLFVSLALKTVLAILIGFAGFGSLVGILDILFTRLFHKTYQKMPAEEGAVAFILFVVILAAATFRNWSPGYGSFVAICCFLWIAYAILEKKAASGLSWRSFIVISFNGLFTKTLIARFWIRKIYIEYKDFVKWVKHHTPRWHVALLLASLLTLCVLLVANMAATDIRFLYFVAVAAIISVGLLKAISSCRWLLAVFFLSFVPSFFAAVQFRESKAAMYLAFVVISSMLWMAVSLLADYDTAKMATQIVNTLTTISAIGVNVLAGWVDAAPQRAMLETAAAIQYEANLLLLPFIFAGYLTALFKDMQAYWEKKHPEILVEKAGFVCITDIVYKI